MRVEGTIIIMGGIIGVRCGEILLISSSTLPWLGRVSAKNVNKLTDFNAAVSSPDYDAGALAESRSGRSLKNVPA